MKFLFNLFAVILFLLDYGKTFSCYNLSSSVCVTVNVNAGVTEGLRLLLDNTHKSHRIGCNIC